MDLRRKLKWWIAGGIAASVIVAVVAFQTHAPALFSVRVIRYTPGDTDALVEITNNVGSPIYYLWWNGKQRGLVDTLEPHNAVQIPVSLESRFNLGGSREVGPQTDKFFYKPMLWIGINLYQWHEVGMFNLTNTTGWIDAKHVERPANSRLR